MNLKKRILVSVFLPLMLFFVFVGISQNALADGTVAININNDVDTALIMKEDDGSNYYSVDNGSTWIEYEGKLIITGSGSETSNCIEVQSGTHDITLSNVIIKNSDGINILKISGGTVNLTLSGDNELSSTWDPAGKNAINVTGNSTLNINGTDNDTLTSDANRSGKKIFIDSGSTVDIKGGNITLRSSYTSIVGGSGTFILDDGSVSLRPDRGNWFDSATNVQINGGYIFATNTTNFGASSLLMNGGVVDLNKGVMDASSFSMTNGVLYVASMTDKTNQSSWNGIVFEGDNDGKIYSSSPVINSNCTIMPGKILYIESGQALSVESGTTVTNNGTIIVHSGGILNANESSYGTVTGAIRREPVTTPSININDDVATALVLKENNGTLLYSVDNGKTWAEYSGTMTVTGNGSETTNRIEVQGGTHDIVLSGVKIKALGNVLKISGGTVNLALSGDNELGKNWEQKSTNTIYVTGNSTLNISGTNSDKLFSNVNNNANNIYIDSGSKLDIKGGNITLWSTKKATVGGSGTFILDGGNVSLRPDPADYNWFDSATAVQINGGNISATNTTNFGASSVVIKGGLVNLNGGAMNASNFSISNGVLYTSSITDKTNQSSWNGIIFEGDYGSIYGSPIINSDCAILPGKILYIESGETLTVESGTTVTNNGTIIVHNGGTLNANKQGYGNVNGAIRTEPISTPSININDDVDTALVLKENNGTLLYSTDNGNTWTEYSGTMTVTGSGGKTTNRIEVQSGTHDIKLDGVSIGTDNCAFNIKGSATANVILSGDNILTSGNGAGLNVASGSSLVITSASTGSLTATGSSGSAGIGSGPLASCGNITIEGGHIIANAGRLTNDVGGAGIGSGCSGGTDCKITCGDITITGGYVEAKGSCKGAGIGTGAACFNASNTGGDITITGGTIKATGYAGIGSGEAWNSSTTSVNAVYISGGNVNATVSKQPVVSDSDNTNVYLTTVTLDGLSTDVAVSDIDTSATYDIEGISTLNSGKLYLYLPENTTVTKAVADGTEYKYNTINTTAEGTEGTLYSSPKTDSNVNIGSDVTTALLFKEDSSMNCYSKDNGANWIPYTGMFTITGSTTDNRIEVQSGTHDITLSGALIKTSGDNALKITGGTVNITLSGDNNLSAAWEPAFTNAIHLTGESTLNIKGTDNDTLTSNENRRGNNIYIDSGSYVNIQGGNITLRSSFVSIVGGLGCFTLEGGNVTVRPDETTIFSSSNLVSVMGGSITSTNGSDFGAINLYVGGGVINMNGGSVNSSAFSMNGGVIYTSSITYSTDQSSWNGIVFEGDNNGKIYGTPAISSDCTLLSGKTLDIQSGETLSVAEGFAVTNNGTIAIYSSGTLNANKDGYGTVDKGIKYESSTDLSFTLKDSSDTITMAGQESTITIKAIITKADTSSDELTEADGTVDFYLGDSSTGTHLGSSDVVFSDGSATASFDVTLDKTKWTSGEKTITAVYKGGTGLLKSENSSSITIIKKDISVNINDDVTTALLFKEKDSVKYYSVDNGSTWNEYVGVATITGSGTSTTNKIEVQSGTHDITLSAVNVSYNLNSASTFVIKGGSIVNLTLDGDNYITNDWNASGATAISVTESSTLNINGTDSDTLTCNSNMGGQRIGIDTDSTVTVKGGNITLNSSNIYAVGGAGTFAVEGGCVNFYPDPAGQNWFSDTTNVVVNGGLITSSRAQNFGAASLTINGGVVNMNGGSMNATSFSVTNGILYAASVTDTSNQSSWNGIVFEGDNNGKIYGTPVISFDCTLLSGRILDIKSGETLVINEGNTVTNNGTVDIYSGATLNANKDGYGTLTGSVKYESDVYEGFSWQGSTSRVTSAVYGKSIVITATIIKKDTEGSVLTSADGTVDFYLGDDSTGTKLGSSNVTFSDGVATATLNATLTGDNWKPEDKTITVVYNGGSNLIASKSSRKFVVIEEEPTVNIGTDVTTALLLKHINEIDYFNYYSKDNGANWIPYTGNMTITGTTDTNRVELLSGSHIIKFDNLNITSDACAFDIKDTATAIIIVTGDNILTSGNGAGLNVSAGGNLIIAAASPGSLTATGSSGAAGIGSGYMSSCGNMTIEGGHIIANAGSLNSGSGGAGIGTGGTSLNITCGDITITGGYVEAKGATNAAGIGLGSTCFYAINTGGNITVAGGTIKATGYVGIGAGKEWNGATASVNAVYISGGNINATANHQPVVSSSDSTPVYFTAITLDGLTNDASVTSLTTSVDYTIRSMSTIDNGKLYLYLPEDATVTNAEANSINYKYNTITTKTDGTAAGILYSAPKTDPIVNINDDVTTALLFKEIDNVNYYSKDNGANWKPYTGTCTVTGTTTANKIEVQSGIQDIKFDNLNISSTNCAFDMENDSVVRLTLVGTNLLQSGSGYAGLQVNEDAILLMSDKNTGSLKAVGGTNGAGIGGGNNGNTGKIGIFSGTIIAEGGTNGAGIGGGNQGNGNQVMIIGGSVKATAGSDDADTIGQGAGGTDRGTIGDASMNDVYLTIVTLDGLTSDAPITSLTTSATYELSGMSTLDSGKLYLYLPEDSTVTNAVVNETEYKYNTIKTTTEGAEGTLYTAAKENQSVDIGTDVTTALLFKEDSGINYYSKDNGANWIPYTGAVTITGTTTDNKIEVQSGTHDIIINGMQIDLSAKDDTCAFSIAGKVNLTLLGDNILKSGLDKAGLEVSADAELSVLEGSTGSLNSTGGKNAAGIGGSKESDSGTITIGGGVITAVGGESGAGIGGGYKGVGGNITINSNTIVIAEAGSEDAQDIGSGEESGTETTPIITKGIVFKGNKGLIYGEPIIGLNCSIPEGKVLSVDNDEKLEVQEGNTISNNGVINMKQGSIFYANKSGYGTITGTINFVPSIIVQPSAQTVSEGKNATFAIQALGTPNYQWQVNKNDGNGWIDISEGSDISIFNSYTTEASRAMYGYKYRCIVYNDAGSTTSTEVLLKVLFDYQIIDGANQTVIKGNSAKFSSDGSLSKFEEVQVDGEDITSTNYTVSSGSTIITLKSSYINTLSEGTHTLNIIFSDAKATTTFIVKAAETSDNPGNSKEGKKDNSGNSKEDKKDSSDNSKDAAKNKYDQTKNDIKVKGSNAQQNTEQDARKSDDSDLESPTVSMYPTEPIEEAEQNVEQESSAQPTSTLNEDLQAGSSSFTSMLPIILICIGAAALVFAFIVHNSKK